MILFAVFSGWATTTGILLDPEMALNFFQGHSNVLPHWDMV